MYMLKSRTIGYERKGLGMTSKSKKSETLELHASPIQPRAEDTSANQAVNHRRDQATRLRNLSGARRHAGE